MTAFAIAVFGALAASATADDGLLDRAVGQTAEVASTAVSPVVEVVTPVAEELVVPVAEVATPVVEQVAEVAQPVLDEAAPVVEVVEEAAAPVVEPLEEAVAPVRELVEDTVAPIVGAVEEVLPPPIGDSGAPSPQPAPDKGPAGPAHAAGSPSQSKPSPSPTVAIPAAILDSVPTLSTGNPVQLGAPAVLVPRDGAELTSHSPSSLDVAALSEDLTQGAGGSVTSPAADPGATAGLGRAVDELAALGERAVTAVASGASWAAGAASTGLVAALAALVLIAFAGCFVRAGPAAARARPLLYVSLLERPG